MSNKADISLSKLQDEVERMCEDREERKIDEVRNEQHKAAQGTVSRRIRGANLQQSSWTGEGILPWDWEVDH